MFVVYLEKTAQIFIKQVVSSSPPCGQELLTLVVIGTDCICRYESNYHNMIKTTLSTIQGIIIKMCNNLMLQLEYNHQRKTTKAQIKQRSSDHLYIIYYIFSATGCDKNITWQKK